LDPVGLVAQDLDGVPGRRPCRRIRGREILAAIREEQRRPGVDLLGAEQAGDRRGGDLADIVDEPGPLDGAGVLEDADGLVAEDLGVGGEQGDEVGPEAARRADLVRDDDVAGVEDVQEGEVSPPGRIWASW
jgi:hypothetical protein